MRQGFLALSLAAVLLLAGAGCRMGDTENKPADGTSTVDGSSTTTVSTEKMTDKKIDSIELKGQAIGNGMVQFNWTLPEGAKDPAGFRLVRSQTENPTQPPGYWFAQAGKARGAIWVKVPTGEQHFRICVYENGACGVYSNNVMVDVK